MKLRARTAITFSIILGLALLGLTLPASAVTAPSVYSAYTGVDPKTIPPPPTLGPANSILIDPTFGSRILRVTDANTAGGMSLIPGDAGFFRTWNADSTALKLMSANGKSWWVTFDPVHFKVGGGSSQPSLHPLSINQFWEWSAVDPHTLYFLNGNQLGKYNISTNTTINLGGPPTNNPVTYHVAVAGRDNWVCSVAGAGTQDTYTKIFCLDPGNPTINKFIDIAKRTINGIAQTDPNWPTAASGQTLGIHSIAGSAGGSWLAVTFIRQSWGKGIAVLNLNSNTWSLAKGSWAGHIALGDGKLVNGSGSTNGRDSRGATIRDPSNMTDATKFVYLMQPPGTIGWHDAEHSSWFNASTNPNAPILFSRYNVTPPPTPMPWYGEIILAAIDGTNTVWRFAHNHNGGGYFGEAFAQISNDGRWALFSSYWGGTLGPSKGDFGIGTRLDTFIVELCKDCS